MSTLNLVLFGVSSLVVLVAGAMVVTNRDLVRAVVWLALCLVATSTVYVSLSAEFIGAVQIILYTGGVVTLMLFGLMLTHRVVGARIVLDGRNKVRGALVALGVFAMMASAVILTPAPAEVPADKLAKLGDTATLGRLFLTEQALALEVLSVLLLLVMVGAIVLARRKDPV